MRQQESGELKEAVERQKKAAGEARAVAEEATAELEREKGKRKRLEDDQHSLRSKVERMHHAAASGTGSQEVRTPLPHSDVQVANWTVRVWHRATENGA